MSGFRKSAQASIFRIPRPGANAYLPEFLADYNKRFAYEPQSCHDTHRPVRDDEDLDRSLASVGAIFGQHGQDV